MLRGFHSRQRHRGNPGRNVTRVQFPPPPPFPQIAMLGWNTYAPLLKLEEGLRQVGSPSQDFSLPEKFLHEAGSAQRTRPEPTVIPYDPGLIWEIGSPALQPETMAGDLRFCRTLRR
jgi:hypothetical protein